MSQKYRMGMTTSLALVLVIIVGIAGLGVGYISGGSGAASKTTTQYSTATQTTTATQLSTLVTTQFSTSTQTATVTTTPNLADYWAQASAATLADYAISRTSLVPLLNAGNSSLYLLDIRSATGNDAYNTGHIAGAINIPYQNMTAAVESNSIPMNKMIIVICYTGLLSSQTMAVLRAMGYNAYYLSLGMSGWNNATRSSTSAPLAMTENYPIVTGTAPGTWTVFNP